MSQPMPIADALAEAAHEINASDDLIITLDSIVRTAVRFLPGVDHVGISIAHRSGQVETMAGTDPVVWDLDAVQYDLHEGPGAYAIDVEPVVIANHLRRHEQRWPNYVPQAVQMGVRAQMGVRLFAEKKTLGGLNLYATTTDTITPDVAHAGRLFAAHAALALGRAHRESQLTEAIVSRKAIGQAVGLVMERYQIDEDQASQFLLRVSSSSNVRLRDVARELIDTANQKFADPPTSETRFCASPSPGEGGSRSVVQLLDDGRGEVVEGLVRTSPDQARGRRWASSHSSQKDA